MFVDASALPEQVADDVITSGFLSAGQRCSSLRHLFVQEDCANLIIEMVADAMETLRIGDPADPTTDVGPVIDEAARDAIEAHVDAMRAKGARIVRRLAVPVEWGRGCFVAPTLIELPDPAMLEKEVFGPVVHVTRWHRDQIDAMLAHVRRLGFGLTLGIHSRVNGFAQSIVRQARCGNAYVNRNMIGAVVGSQPFGGLGLSGTGPKAGGPNYLVRFATEETETVNVTAIGGDIDLLMA
jgi:RHH-type proline utilization regulon transcriptional repressor/proline dehydrogenase/delta 1-pyrroline-5-carboxylate dehydrogenase